MAADGAFGLAPAAAAAAAVAAAARCSESRAAKADLRGAGGLEGRDL